MKSNSCVSFYALKLPATPQLDNKYSQPNIVGIVSYHINAIKNYQILEACVQGGVQSQSKAGWYDAL